TMSFAAAICSIVSDGIVPIEHWIFRSFGLGSDVKLTQWSSCFQPMKKILLFLVIACVSSGLNHPAVAGARDLIHKGDVVVVPLRGEVSPSLLMFLRRAEKAAENNGAAAIIFEMNTYGGRLDTAEEITSV